MNTQNPHLGAPVSQYQTAVEELRGDDTPEVETLWDQQVSQFLMLPEDTDRQLAA